MFEIPTVGGGFFKAAEHMSDLAIVLEPKRVFSENDPFNPGQQREVAVADIAIFRDNADVEKAEPSEVMLDATITGQVLVSDIKTKGWEGKVALVQIDKTKSGRGYVFRPVTFPGAAEAAEKWFKAREEKREADKESFPFGK